MAKRNGKAHMAYVRSFRRTKVRNAPRRRRRVARRRKANPWPMAGLVANPRRRRRRNPHLKRRSRRHHYSRNPKILGIDLPVQDVVFAGVGFIAPATVEGLLASYIPSSLTGSNLGQYAIKIASVLGISFAIRKFVGVRQGNMALIGGGVYVLSVAAAQYMPSLLSGQMFSALAPVSSGVQYGPSAPATVSGYVRANRQLAAYVPASGRTFNTLGAMPSAALIEGNMAAARFKRF